MIIDTHSHLFADEFNNDLDLCINNCLKNDIRKVVLVGFSESTNNKALSLTMKYPNFFYNTAGLHPSEVKKDYLMDIKKLEEFILKHRVYAIGECGIDYHYGKELEIEQKEAFKLQILLSIKYDLPVIIHMRDATFDTYEILKEYKGKIKGIMHCYSGSYEMALKFIELGLYISIGGPVTFKNAVEPKRVAKNIDINYLLVETDCPYLAPTPYRGKRNESAYIINIIEEISKLRDCPYEELCNTLFRNAMNLFKIKE